MLMLNGVIKLIDFGCAKRLCFNLSVSQTEVLKSMKGESTDTTIDINTHYYVMLCYYYIMFISMNTTRRPVHTCTSNKTNETVENLIMENR